MATVALAALIGCSAFFSATETAYTSMNRIRLKNLAKEGDKRAEKTLEISEDYDKLLTTVLVGNNLVNILSSSICTWIFTENFGAVGVPLATVVMLVTILILGEITPKSYGKANAEKFAMRARRPLRAVMIILWPLVVVFKGIAGGLAKRMAKKDEEAVTLTEDELLVFIEEIEEEGTIEQAESKLIKSAISFDDKTVDGILIPRVDVVAVERGVSMDDLRDVLLSSGFSRIPVYEGSIDDIVGVVYAKDFYNWYFDGKEFDTSDVMRPVKFIPESTTLAKAFSEMQKSIVHMLIVVDSHGGTVGILSMEDLLEELVGEIWDESDEVQHAVTKEHDGSYSVLGDANVYEAMEAMGIELDTEGFDEYTVGGFIQFKLGRVPIKGDRLRDGNVLIIVRNVKNRRVRLAQFIVKEKPAAEPIAE
ncbi:MAG: HlyC/CorC family transporter [Thermoplasmatales archaeon]|nr:HlyC/CorC family transporter [Thermoplasmatales archaeon]